MRGRWCLSGLEGKSENFRTKRSWNMEDTGFTGASASVALDPIQANGVPGSGEFQTEEVSLVFVLFCGDPC